MYLVKLVLYSEYLKRASCLNAFLWKASLGRLLQERERGLQAEALYCLRVRSFPAEEDVFDKNCFLCSVAVICGLCRGTACAELHFNIVLLCVE